MLEAAAAMELWRRADFEGERIVIDALVRRRASEKLLFLKPDFAWPAAPSPVLPPKIDYEAASLLPNARHRPALESPGWTASGRWPMQDRRRRRPRRRASMTPAGPSATEQAAAAVGERLERLLPEETPRDIEPLEEKPAEGETPEVDGAAAPFEESSDRSPSVAADAAFAELLRRRPRQPPRRQIPTIALVVLAVVGVALLSAAIRWGFQPYRTSPLAAGVLGWGLGTAGVVSTACAIYGLVARFSGRSADDSI